MSDRSMTLCDVLILAAFPPELAALRPHLGPTLEGGIGGVSVAAAAVGIGLAAASAGAALRIQAHAPRAVVLVGTCGVYRATFEDGVALGQVGIAGAVRLTEPAAIQRKAGYPAPMTVALDGDPALRDGLRGPKRLRVLEVANTLGITTDDPLAAEIAASGAHAEHLEAFGVATACAAQKVPFAAVLGVANVVGSTAREEWREHHQAAGDAAVRAVLAWLDAGASGLSDTRPPHALLA